MSNGTLIAIAMAACGAGIFFAVIEARKRRGYARPLLIVAGAAIIAATSLIKSGAFEDHSATAQHG